MPQVQLPVFPDGVTHITSEIALSGERKACYFNGHLPVFIQDQPPPSFPALQQPVGDQWQCEPE